MTAFFFKLLQPPRDVTVAPLPHLSATFGRQLDTDALSHGPGLVASNRGRLVVVAFPDGLLASYESDLPVWRPAPMNTKLWSQPVFVAAMGEFILIFVSAIRMILTSCFVHRAHRALAILSEPGAPRDGVVVRWRWDR